MPTVAEVSETTLREILKSATMLIALKRDGDVEVSDRAASGTFVRIGNARGILTAEHVVEDFFVEETSSLGIVASEEEHNFTIPSPRQALRAVRWDVRRSDPWGPDVSVVLLPDVAADRAERLGRVFYDLDANKDHRLLKRDGQRNTVWAVYGAPAVDQVLGHGVNQLNIFSYIATARKFKSRDGLQYVEVSASSDPPAAAPTKLGGLSGGGLWILKLARKGAVSMSTGEFALGGVGYFGRNPVKGTPGFLRCHGAEDLYGKAVPRIAAGITGGEGWRDLSCNG